MRLEENKDLSRFFTMGIASLAQFYCRVHSEVEIIEACEYARKNNLQIRFLAGGSNVVPSQNKVSGLVIHNFHKEIDFDDCEVKVASGYPMGMLVKETIARGLSGFEYRMGLPGSVGGAICMNSKWTKPLSYVSDNLVSAKLLTPEGKIREVDHGYFQFAYDYSILKETGEILLEAKFKLQKMEVAQLKQRAESTKNYRYQTQPVSVATAGCFFQNITEEERQIAQSPYLSAGYLIDQAGLKNYRVGGMTVSDKHANFLVNSGGATAEDLKQIVAHIKRTIKAKFGIALREEVIWWS